MSDDRPIGMFDSGFGGLTVARAVIDLLPDEDLVYVGDSGRYPYGPRPRAEVRGFAHQITRFLVDEHDVKMVIVACNTAEAAAFHELRAATDVPVLGVIDPGVRALVSATTSGQVGVIGTVGTISSGAYQRAVEATGAPVKLTCAACPGFVEFVERGETDTDQVHVLAERLLAPGHRRGGRHPAARVHPLPLPRPHVGRRARPRGGAGVVGRRDRVRGARGVRRPSLGRGAPHGRPGGPRVAPARHRFLSSGDVAWFRELGGRLLGPELADAEAVTWAPAPPGSPAA